MRGKVAQSRAAFARQSDQACLAFRVSLRQGRPLDSTDSKPALLQTERRRQSPTTRTNLVDRASSVVRTRTGRLAVQRANRCSIRHISDTEIGPDKHVQTKLERVVPSKRVRSKAARRS